MQRRHLCAMLLAAAALPSSVFAQGASPIRIGAVLSTTGPVGFIGEPQLKVLEFQIKRLNEQGGLLGRKIELVAYDDQSDPGNANTFAKRLIESDKVDVLVGGTVTPTALAMVPHAERARVPYVSAGGGAALAEPVKKWVFKTPPSDRLVAERILHDMREKGITRIGMLSENSGFGQSGRKEVKASAERFGITLAADEIFGSRDTDVTPQLTKIRSVQGLQSVLFFTGAGATPAMTLKNYAQLGMKLPVYMPHAAVNPELVKLAGAASEGARMPTAAFVVVDELPDTDKSKAIGLSYYREYKQAYGADASPFGANVYDAIQIVVEAIRRAGTTDKDKVRDAIEATQGLVGLNGTYNMSPSEHNGLDLNALRMVQVRDGRFVMAR